MELAHRVADYQYLFTRFEQDCAAAILRSKQLIEKPQSGMSVDWMRR